eukprot:gene9034-9970_t
MTSLVWFLLAFVVILQVIQEGIHSEASQTLDDAFAIPPATVEELDKKAYLGRWYQVYASLVPNVTFEQYGYCVTADYYPTNIEGAAFGVTNAQRLYGPKGKLRSVNGYATGTSSPGKFLITFDTSNTNNEEDLTEVHDHVLNFQDNNDDKSRRGHYWVIDLGPVVDGKYDWSVVSVPFGTSLYILARDVEKFRSQYESQVLEDVKKKGFKYPFNKPLPTYQSSDCDYAPQPEPSLSPSSAPATFDDNSATGSD